MDNDVMNTIEQLKIDKQIAEQRIESELISLSEKYGGLSMEISLEQFDLKDDYSKCVSQMFDVKLEVKI